ncbi:NAD(P)H-binding protein [Streptomyces genisteinicus]|uniref:NAD(P)H-binding protein n=1 Tax=Streptomyces genisteinicus TaxID=2768068 RepID=A0A7H0I543_9ACTN|nr:NAD(P)H-binding protein [Streptomyces genisteinicus]QNP67909.1 NAD(P)H-binding protein [Streptomyces genisteinicus]
MILVTGATGTVGREVVRRLPEGVPARLLSRNAASAPVRPAHEAVVADYGDDASLGRALAGVRTALLVTCRVGEQDDVRFLRAARRAGVERVVKLSAAAVLDPLADDLITRWQRDNEKALRDSGLEWTLLRPRSFMSNTLSWAASVRSERVVRALYGTSANACADPRDIAEVAVRTLTEGGHAGRSYTLTGPAAVTPVEQAHHLGQALGVTLRFEELTPERTLAALRTRHPEPVAQALMASALRQRDGAKTQVVDAVRSVTGSPARPFRVWAEDHRAAFGPEPAGAAAAHGV